VKSELKIGASQILKFFNIMKKIIVLLPFLALMCFCSQAQQRTTQQTQRNVILLDKEGFLKHVYNFEKNPNQWVFEGNLPAIVNFYADWCPPCRMMAPILEELAAEYKGRIVIYKVDTVKSQDLAQIFQIRSLPTSFFIPLGEQPQSAMGAFQKEQLRQMIETILLKN